MRERNAILEFDGLASSYPEVPVSSAAIAPFREAMRRMTAAHQSYRAYRITPRPEAQSSNELVV